MSEEKFEQILASPKASKSGGTDQSNADIFSLAPQATQQWILRTVNYFLSHQIPSDWSTSNVFSTVQVRGPPKHQKLAPHFLAPYHIQITVHAFM